MAPTNPFMDDYRAEFLKRVAEKEAQLGRPLTIQEVNALMDDETDPDDPSDLPPDPDTSERKR